MAVLSPAVQERLFLLGLGVTAIGVVRLMRQLLIKYRDAALEPPTPSKPSSYITQTVEDSLNLSTLDKLLYSPNFCIQETAAIIVCERAVHDPSTISDLLWYIAQPDHDTREKGVRTLTMMMNSSTHPATIELLNEPSTYAALVKSLEYSLTDYEHAVHAEHDLEWDSWPLRDVAEQDCLLILTQLVNKCGPEGLVKARFIERWLAKEPWGDDDRERQINFLESLRMRNRLAELTLPLIRDPSARKLLCGVGLLPMDFEWDVPSSRDVRMINGESTAGEDFDGMYVGRRIREQNSVEETIRRRHREAIVMNDGTRPLAQDDIIEREVEVSMPLDFLRELHTPAD
ncbi:hypothetical protein LSUE1_G001555 [Lachnellula suecica]|uniref:Cytoskeleton-associated protein n=1 Tax=Lachnellula suecica TaxID=602035 RepID=A0A8T9CDG9_9HELO|nr:hypothetical protein LSUE1_G001555 [Lachnellula suecica]